MKSLIVRCSLIISLLILLGTSCKKSEVITSIPTRGGLALTFDDFSVSNWHDYLYLFDSLKVKCTFYVSNYNKLSGKQIAELHDIQNHGHEIAFHSTNHVDFVKHMQNHGLKNLMEDEVNRGLELMNSDGFYPSTFAYPYGQHNLILDKILLKKFKSIRLLNGTHDCGKSLASISGNSIIRGMGIDETSKRRNAEIVNLLSSANELDKCAVLLVHNIERKDTKMQLPLSKLREILVKAKSLHLRFYTISEISH